MANRSKLLMIVLICVFFSCNMNTNHVSHQITTTHKSIAVRTKRKMAYQDSLAELERQIYFKIDQIYTGPSFTDKNNIDAFYRILVIPEEENIMLLTEKIEISGEDGSNFKLLKLSRITNDNSALPKFGLAEVKSLRFIDPTKFTGYFNGEERTIDLDKLNNYHP